MSADITERLWEFALEAMWEITLAQRQTLCRAAYEIEEQRRQLAEAGYRIEDLEMQQEGRRVG